MTETRTFDLNDFTNNNFFTNLLINFFNLFHPPLRQFSNISAGMG